MQVHRLTLLISYDSSRKCSFYVLFTCVDRTKNVQTFTDAKGSPGGEPSKALKFMNARGAQAFP